MTGTQPIIIDRPFNGPPDSGNGGYVCGVIANQMTDLPAGMLPEVMLRLPPPLDTPMQLHRDGNQFALKQGEADVALGRPSQWTVTPPALPDWDAIVAGGETGKRIRGPIYTTCMVCGQDRHDHYGLRIMAGQVEGQTYLAAPWTPHAALADDTGLVRPEFVWAALDCPSGFTIAGGSNLTNVTVLGTFSVAIKTLPRAGEDYGITAWLDSRDGRKSFCYSALYTKAGDVLATAKSIWIELKQ